MVHEGPYQDKAKQIYKELRKNVVDNVVKVCGKRIIKSVSPKPCRNMNARDMYGNNMTPLQVKEGEGMSHCSDSFLCCFTETTAIHSPAGPH